MTEKHRKLAAQLLRLASNEFSNHGCNDMDWPADWTADDIREFSTAYREWNGDAEHSNDSGRCLPDFCAMDFLAAMLDADDPMIFRRPKHLKSTASHLGRGT